MLDFLIYLPVVKMLIALAGQIREQQIVQGLVLCCVPGTEILEAAMK